MLLFLPIVLVTSLALSKFFTTLKLPSVVGEIVAGIVLGSSVLRLYFTDPFVLTALGFLSELGIVFLLFLAGLEIDIEKIRDNSRDSLLIGFGAALTPLLFGFAVLMLLGFDMLTSLIFGGAIAVTSEGTKVKVLMDSKQLDTPLGAIMVSAGAMDDVFEVFFLSLVIILSGGGTFFDIIRLPFELFVFITFAYIFFKVVSRLISDPRFSCDSQDLLSIAFIFVLSLAAISQILELGFILGALIGGFLLQIVFYRNESCPHSSIVENIKLITVTLLVPFFFVNIGLNFELSSFLTNVGLLAISLLIAIGGKILGTLLVKPWSRLETIQLYYIGWAMNSRGATELVIALIALQNGLIPVEVFSSLVAISVITTLIFPIILTQGIKKHPRLMHRTD